MKQITLIKSDSFYLLKERINELVTNPENVTKLSLSTNTIQEIIDDASYSGMFGSDRTVIVTDTKYFGGKFLYEDDVNLLVKFLSNINDINIIFICDDINSKKSSTKNMVSLGANIIELNCTDLVSAINEYTKTINVSIDKKAIDLLIKNCSNNLDIILGEINKYSIITNVINESVINEYGFKIEDINTLDFNTAVVTKKFDTAFTMLDNLIKNGVEPVAIVGLLASSFTNMYLVKDALSYNLSDEEICSLIGCTSGRLYYLKKESRIYTIDNLKEIIYSLCELDKKIKKGYNPNNIIKEFLLTL